MEFFNNNYRKYLGLQLLKDSYICKEYEKDNTKYYVYFDKNKMVKVLKVSFTENQVMLHEKGVDYDTTEDNTILLPKTSKGHPRKITCSLIDNLNGIGTYFFIDKEKNEVGRCIIGNYTTQRTFFEETIKEELNTKEDLIKWLDLYVAGSTDEELLEIEQFSKDKIKHIKYKEGDYFRVKYGRNLYGYGRILMDITKRRKEGMKYWDILMCRPLIVEMFHILTENKNVSISTLEELPTFPSQHIMDNNLYYGDYEIIGNGKIPLNIKYPIMYGESISALNPNKIMFQCGEIYREMEYNDNLIKSDNSNLINAFINNGVSFNININKEILEKALDEKSNNSYWEYHNWSADRDLRAPQNRKYLLAVLKQFDLEELYKIYYNEI